MEDLDWYDVREWGVEGRGFDDTESYFDRLPARAHGVVRDEVWGLSHDTAGMSAQFTADTTAVHVRYTTTRDRLALPHMPATGASGVDLYAQHAPEQAPRHGSGHESGHESEWRWIGTHKPGARVNVGVLCTGIAPGKRAYRLHLPIYNGIESIEIGVPAGTTFSPTPPRTTGPILFYGTSITQGDCASRPGMAFPDILGRRLDRPVLNFGFSGQGRTELEVARFIAELDPAIFVIDTVANTADGGIDERMVPLVELIVDRRPTTPVLLLGERVRPDMALVPEQQARHQGKAEALRRAYETLRSRGLDTVHHRAGDDLLGFDGEGTVDGSHPDDLGMLRYADALEGDLRRLIRPPDRNLPSNLG